MKWSTFTGGRADLTHPVGPAELQDSSGRWPSRSFEIWMRTTPQEELSSTEVSRSGRFSLPQVGPAFARHERWLTLPPIPCPAASAASSSYHRADTATAPATARTCASAGKENAPESSSRSAERHPSSHCTVCRSALPTVAKAYPNKRNWRKNSLLSIPNAAASAMVKIPPISTTGANSSNNHK